MAAPASGQVGAPVVGQFAYVAANVVSVRWTGTEDDPEHQNEAATLGGYTLFGALSPGGAAVARLTLPWPPPDLEFGVPLFTIPNVPDGTYYVAVVKGLVESATIPAANWSQVTVSYTTCGSPPGAPTNLRRAVNSPSADVLLFWNLHATGCLPENIQIEAGYSPGATDAGVYLLRFDYGWSGAAPPGTYYVRVRARNRFGVSAPSNEIQVVVAPPFCNGPGPPVNLTFTVLNRQVTLNWASGNPGSQPIIYYIIGAGFVPGVTNFGLQVLAPQTTFVANSVPPGIYYVRVYAANGCRNHASLPSNEVQIVVP